MSLIFGFGGAGAGPFPGADAQGRHTGWQDGFLGEVCWLSMTVPVLPRGLPPALIPLAAAVILITLWLVEC